MTKKITCAQCGKMFTPDRKDRKLCSKECRNERAPIPCTYPWDRWFAKSAFVVRAKDYECQVHGMVAQIRNRARRLGLRVVINSRKDGSIAVRVV